ncbi:MAG: acetate/propionate family kinase [Aquificaceae bacterium]|nr:acetate/propionate family kinase [Aquificaceae bacterium]
MKTFLSLNYGSSSLKYALFEETRPIVRASYPCRGLEELEGALESLIKQLPIEPEVVAHRVVHGMEHRGPMLIEGEGLELLEELAHINPLHNALALIGVKKSLTLFPRSKHYALFDTDFHKSIPPHARVYGLDYRLYEEGIKRYGFHGISYSYLLRKVKETLHKDRPNLIMMHLGQGCSICAVKEGFSVETSMGFSPLEGLMMVSRPGDLDPGILLELLNRGYSAEELKNTLYHRAGLGAIAGVHSFKELLLLKDEDKRAALAFDAFMHRLLKYVGAYWFLLEGKVDALLFSGGIGENSPEVREALCSRLSFLGVELDMEANKESRLIVSKRESSTKVMVMKTDEELEMVLRLMESVF